MRSFLAIFAVLGSTCLAAQSPVTESDISAKHFTAYVEPYYSYEFNKPSDGNKPAYFYSYNRDNEVNINLGMVKYAIGYKQVRANVALAAGTYMNANYAAESGVMKHVYEMNAGVQLSSRHNLWLDAGVFGSHIGFESAIGKDCRTLTRSLGADSSPYFESGAKVTYTTADEKWTVAGLVLNGWQRIQKVSGNSLPSFGAQVLYKPTERITLNSSSFAGTDKPDIARQMRYFHDFYAIFQLNERWETTLGFDIGWEQKTPGSARYNTWYTPVAILRYAPNDKWAMAARAEYFADPNGVIIPADTQNGFRVSGLSCNVDYTVSHFGVLRIEGRYLRSKDDIFVKGNQAVNSDFFLTSGFAVSF